MLVDGSLRGGREARPEQLKDVHTEAAVHMQPVRRDEGGVVCEGKACYGRLHACNPDAEGRHGAAACANHTAASVFALPQKPLWPASLMQAYCL